MAKPYSIDLRMRVGMFLFAVGSEVVDPLPTEWRSGMGLVVQLTSALVYPHNVPRRRIAAFPV